MLITLQIAKLAKDNIGFYTHFDDTLEKISKKIEKTGPETDDERALREAREHLKSLESKASSSSGSN